MSYDLIDYLADAYSELPPGHYPCQEPAICNEELCSFLWCYNTRNEPVVFRTPVPKPPLKTYLVTFTKRPDTDRDTWVSKVTTQLDRRYIKRFKATLEHVTTNLHCHAIIYTREYITKRHFTAFPGHVDIKKVQTDNGLSKYISKENKICTNTIEIQTLYNELKNGLQT